VNVSPRDHAYGSLLHVISVLLLLLVASAAAMNIAALARLWRGHDEREREFTALQMQLTHMYWWFTAVVGALVFGVLHASPYLL